MKKLEKIKYTNMSLLFKYELILGANESQN
jgi:hypothetical protein